MTINKKKQIKNMAQEGITLLLSILVLASVMAISFSIATITLVEIRSSGDLTRTEVSYYGGSAAAEQALYKVKRKINTQTTGQCDTSLPGCYYSNIGPVTIVSPSGGALTESTVSDPVQQDSFPPFVTMSGNNFPSAAKHYPFYNPGNVSGPSNFSKVVVTYLSTNTDEPLTIYMCEYDPGYRVGDNSQTTVPCSDPTDSASGYWRTPTGGSSLRQENSPMTFALNPSKQQEMIIFNQNQNADSKPIYAQIQAFDASNNPAGIPYFQQESVDINAQNSSVNRKIRVLIPLNGGSSGGAGPIAYWKLDEPAGATTFVDSAGTNNGSCASGACPTTGASGKVNSAATFDGINDVISVPDSPTWTFSGDFTLALWVKASSWSGNWWTRAFLGQDEGGGPLNKWIFSYDGTHTILLVYSSASGGPYLIGNAWAPATDTWYHLAVTRKGNLYTFYRNGIPDGTQTDSTPIPNIAAPLTIGWAEGAGSFNGTLDDVRIYNRALTAAEISALAQ